MSERFDVTSQLQNDLSTVITKLVFIIILHHFKIVLGH